MVDQARACSQKDRATLAQHVREQSAGRVPPPAEGNHAALQDHYLSTSARVPAAMPPMRRDSLVACVATAAARIPKWSEELHTLLLPKSHPEQRIPPGHP